MINIKRFTTKMATKLYSNAANALILAYRHPHKIAISSIALGVLASSPSLVLTGAAIEAWPFAKSFLDKKFPQPFRRRKLIFFQGRSLGLNIQKIRSFTDDVNNIKIVAQRTWKNINERYAYSRLFSKKVKKV